MFPSEDTSHQRRAFDSAVAPPHNDPIHPTIRQPQHSQCVARRGRNEPKLIYMKYG